MKSNSLDLAFDVGHSSIGWAVLENPGTADRLKILGCGVVTFRADDCLASSRRAYRRQRRHIRSTRQRIARMKVLLEHVGVLKRSELDAPGCAWPWLLAARVLRGGTLLSWTELWNVLRWYAHNRGYDGNRRWSAAEAEAQPEDSEKGRTERLKQARPEAEAQAEDSEKEENAKTLMEKHGAKTMAETFCAVCGIDPLGEKRSANLPGDKRPKGQNAAFPRAVVEAEVRRILRAHFGKLPRVDADLERALVGRDDRDRDAWRAIACPGLKLPNRYEGALLFGQVVPRFDNRIISECPVSGKKVPSRNCREFREFRWAMQLANVRVARLGEKELVPLSVAEREQLDRLMRELGSMGPQEFKKHVRELSGAIRDNLETMLMHPDAKEALVLDPVQKLIQSSELRAVWPLLPERLQKRARGGWRRGKASSLARLRQQVLDLGGDLTGFDLEVTRQMDAMNTRSRKQDRRISREEYLNRLLRPAKKLDGRAAYARNVLAQAREEVMAGRDPREAGGCLYITEEMRRAQMEKSIAVQTNNHLVRHRLLILERLVADIVKEYAKGQNHMVGKITIEVNRDLREMSGMTAKQKAQDLGLRIANHHHVVSKLESDETLMNILERRKARVTAGLIRKARVADDLDWSCPYTGQKFQPVDLLTKRVDKDHIVPRSDRASDSLDSLVITFTAVNKFKGKRTAWKFVEEEQGKPVPDLPNLSIMSLARYKSLVESLDTFRGHDDDKRRRKRRKELMLLESYEEKEFVPRDLTQTSQVVRLGAIALRRAFRECKEQPLVVSLPGAVTGTVRKAWRVLGCLSLAAPQVLDEHGEVKTKEEVREVTHLHHALDACVLGLASEFIKNDGRVWELILKRNWTAGEERELKALGILEKDSTGKLHLRDLDEGLKKQIGQRLAEKRVVQHVAARMDGLRVEQNTWRVVSVKDGEAILRQRTRQADGSRPLKQTSEKVAKLLGLGSTSSGKLQANRGALVIPENFGVALAEHEPIIIPFHKVWPRLRDLKAAGNGKMPRVLRNGQLIRIPDGKRFQGIWRVFSAKNNAAGIALDIGSPDVVRLKNKTEGHKINVLLASLIKSGMEVLKTPLTGIASCPTTSSASTRPGAR